jgi:hypothetical protein
VTDDDWMIAVTTVPANTALNRLVVSRARTVRIPSPATSLRASVIWSMPKRNSANPPNSSMAIAPTRSVSVVSARNMRFVLRAAARPGARDRSRAAGRRFFIES